MAWINFVGNYTQSISIATEQSLDEIIFLISGQTADKQNSNHLKSILDIDYICQEPGIDNYMNGIGN